jgi:hypothetical protein
MPLLVCDVIFRARGLQFDERPMAAWLGLGGEAPHKGKPASIDANCRAMKNFFYFYLILFCKKQQQQQQGGPRHMSQPADGNQMTPKTAFAPFPRPIGCAERPLS